MNKFEKLIELVVEGEDAKAEELFHEIVVEKSRDIYESLMDSEDEFGGDAADELINDISADEKGMREEDEEAEMEPEMGDMGGEEEFGGPEMGDEEAGEEDLEDRVVDLEDQLDALMAEFDAVIGGDEAGEFGEPEMGGDEFGEPEMGGEEEMMAGAFESEEADDEAVTEEDENALEEGVELKKVTTGIAGTTEGESVGSGSEATNINKKSINAHNSGKKGAVAKPQQSSGEENGRTAPEVKAGDGTTEPNESKVKEPKKSGEDSGVNKKSISGS